MNSPNPVQIELAIKSFSMQKDRLKIQIAQLNTAIMKKQATIETFRQYVKDYEGGERSNFPNTLQIIQNNQAFCLQLAKVIFTENNELKKLAGIKNNLVANYHQLVNKIDGLSSLCDNIKREQAILLDKRIESELADLSVNFQAEELSWNR